MTVLSIQVGNAAPVAARLREMNAAVRKRLKAAITLQALALVRAVKEEKLSGQVLGQRTRRLRNSIHAEVTETATGVTATVGTNVVYARIHEFGGQTPPHVIVPRAADALRFMMGGKLVFAKKVNHPGSKIPERSFLRSTLAEHAGEIRDAIADAIGEELEP